MCCILLTVLIKGHGTASHTTGASVARCGTLPYTSRLFEETRHTIGRGSKARLGRNRWISAIKFFRQGLCGATAPPETPSALPRHLSIHTHDFYTNIFGMAGALLARLPACVTFQREIPTAPALEEERGRHSYAEQRS